MLGDSFSAHGGGILCIRYMDDVPLANVDILALAQLAVSAYLRKHSCTLSLTERTTLASALGPCRHQSTVH